MNERDTNLFFFSSDIYSESNPGGYVNLGTAVNSLCEGKLLAVFSHHYSISRELMILKL